MEPRNWIGLILILAGIIIQPVGWMYYTWLTFVSFLLIAIGVFIFITQKYIESSEAREFEERSSGPALPGDIHDYSGWGRGGRSTSSESSYADSDVAGED